MAGFTPLRTTRKYSRYMLKFTWSMVSVTDMYSSVCSAVTSYEWSIGGDAFCPCTLPAGQEAYQSPVRRAGPPPELLQVHGTGVQRDVPPLLHQAAALQSHKVPTAIQIDGAPPLSCTVIPRHSKSSKPNVTCPLSSSPQPRSIHRYTRSVTNYLDFLYLSCLSHDAFQHLWAL